MISYILLGMFVFIIASLFIIIIRASLRKTTILGGNKTLSTLTIISAASLIIYIGISYVNNNKELDETYSVKEINISYLLKNKNIIKINIDALWNVCLPDYYTNKNRYYLQNIVGHRAYVIIGDHVKNESRKVNGIEELIKKTRNPSFILKINNASREHGICIKEITISPYNKALQLTSKSGALLAFGSTELNR